MSCVVAPAVDVISDTRTVLVAGSVSMLIWSPLAPKTRPATLPDSLTVITASRVCVLPRSRLALYVVGS